jgi:ABC-type phosphate transport system substrate-binding protein
LTGLFGAFGSLNPNDQKSIANAISKTNHVILAVTKIQANSLNSADKEVPSIRQIMESEHKNPKELFAALKLKAPKLSSFLQTVFTKGSAEFAAHANKLEAPARKGLTIVMTCNLYSKYATF